MEKPLVIFDLDSTLLEGDCELMWCEFMSHKGMVDTAFLKTIEQYCVDYETGVLNYADFERFLLHPLTQMNSNERNPLIQEYLQGIQPLFRPFMLKRVEDHRAKDHALLLATAANSLLAQPIAAMLGISDLICSWMEMKNDIPTGELAGEAPFRDGKAKNIQAWIQKNPVTLVESWAYSDSHNDLPILKMVAHPVAVTPDSVLRQHSLQNGWQIIERPEVIPFS